MGFCHINHVVWNTLHFFFRGLGCADIHVLVHIHGVAGYYLTVICFGKLHRQGGLAGGSGPGNADDIVHGYCLLLVE